MMPKSSAPYDCYCVRYREPKMATSRPHATMRILLRPVLDKGAPSWLASPVPLYPSRSFAVPLTTSTPWVALRRSYATHHSSTVRDSPEAAQARARLHKAKAEAARQHAARTGGLGGSGFEGQERVGPFPLGVGPSGRNRGWKRWSDLGLGGKCECLRFPLQPERGSSDWQGVMCLAAVSLIRSGPHD